VATPGVLSFSSGHCTGGGDAGGYRRRPRLRLRELELESDRFVFFFFCFCFFFELFDAEPFFAERLPAGRRGVRLLIALTAHRIKRCTACGPPGRSGIKPSL
jgi:hypothetical protein